MAHKRIVMSGNTARVETDSFFNPRSWTLWLLAVTALSLACYNVGHAYGTNVVMADDTMLDAPISTVVKADEPALVVAAR